MYSYKNLEKDAINLIDAAVFSSDMFFNQENIDTFRKMMARWERTLKEFEEILNDPAYIDETLNNTNEKE